MTEPKHYKEVMQKIHDYLEARRPLVREHDQVIQHPGRYLADVHLDDRPIRFSHAYDLIAQHTLTGFAKQPEMAMNMSAIDGVFHQIHTGLNRVIAAHDLKLGLTEKEKKELRTLTEQ